MAAVCALQPIPIRQQRLAARLIQRIPSEKVKRKTQPDLSTGSVDKSWGNFGEE